MLNQTDLSRTDLNLLVLFETVLQERHVGRAAERLSLSPSAVSHGLGRLRRLLSDPLFLRTPRGVVPTERALALAEPIADVLARTRSVLATAEPFNPANSTRRFVVGAPDGVAAAVLMPWLDAIGRMAPSVDIALRQLLPAPGEREIEKAWRGAFEDLDARRMDVAVVPLDTVPARFHRRSLYEEDFVLALRRGHPHAGGLSVETYAALSHVVVSMDGDPNGFVDEVLAARGLSRRVALTVPNFLFALMAVARTDLVAAVPRRFAEIHAASFGVEFCDPPLPLGRFRLKAVAPKAALADAGLSWLLDLLEGAQGAPAEREAPPAVDLRRPDRFVANP